MQGTIFDVQRGSVVDGYGVRTTVFFKGCPMRCVWCHNPESQEFYPQLMFQKEKCRACRKCIDACPKRACETIFIDRKKCINCGLCAKACSFSAKTLCGYEVSVPELFDIIVKDKPFYESSGGGVTFSGGEPLLQAGFLAEVSKLCKAQHIHVAIDTAGLVDWGAFKRVLPWSDTFLFDIKAINCALHQRGTGVSNALILENIKKLDSVNTRIHIRIPVIRGFNATEIEMTAIAEFVEMLHFVEKVELLPYHALGFLFGQKSRKDRTVE